MISKRTSQLIAVGVALRKKDFSLLADSFGFKKKSPLRARARKVWNAQVHTPKQVASNYLEYIFGWKPMLQDIYSAAQVLSSTPQSVKLTGSGKERTTYNSIYSDNGTVRNDVLDYERRVKVGGTVIITNPNLDLANRMGVVNVPHVAYNVLPLSFLVDWFIPVGRMLERYTDFVGRSLSGAYVSTKVTATGGVHYSVQTVGNFGFDEEGRGFARFTPSSFPVPTHFPVARLPVSGLLGRAQSLVALFIQTNSRFK